MASGIYNRFKANLMNKEVDLEGDTIRIALLNSSHSFTATDNTWSDVSANEVSGTGYTANGEALANKSVTQGSTTKWDADNVTWSGCTFNVSHAVIYDDTLANDDLICSIDFGGQETLSDQTLTIEFDSDGIITLD